MQIQKPNSLLDGRTPKKLHLVTVSSDGVTTDTVYPHTNIKDARAQVTSVAREFVEAFLNREVTPKGETPESLDKILREQVSLTGSARSGRLIVSHANWTRIIEIATITDPDQIDMWWN